MSRIRFSLFAGFLALLLAGQAYAAAPDIAVTTGSLNFNYQIGGATPAVQTFGLKSTGAALAFTIFVVQPAACSAPCVTVSTVAGTTPATVQVYANPSGLAAGAYGASIIVNAPSAVTTSQSVAVTLTVGNQPSSLSASSNALSFTYTTGSGGSTAQTSNVVVTTNGDALTASVSVAGGTWLKASPTGSIALLGLPEMLTITADAAGLAPSLTPYKGNVIISSSNALNKSVTISVTLLVSAGVPTIAASNGIWPPGAPAGSAGAVTVTITGTNFTAASTALSGMTSLTPVTVINSTTMLATIPAALMAAPGSLPIAIQTVTATAASTPVNFTVYDPAVPQVWAAVDSASYVQGTVSPGEIITIYGAGLGPGGITSFSGASVPTSLGIAGANTSITIDGNAAPILYTSPTQVSCIVPLAVAPGTASGAQVNLVVTYNGVPAAVPLSVNVASTNPGIFTLGASGQGAILNINTGVIPNDYSVNGSKNQAAKGSWVAIYATGFGATTCNAAPSSACDSPAPTEAQFVGGGTVTPVGAVAVTIGGQQVTSPVAVVPVGSVIGLLQINAQIPATVTAGNAVPVVLTVGGATSTALATIAVK